MKCLQSSVLVLAVVFIAAACSDNASEPTPATPAADETQPADQATGQQPAEPSVDLRAELADPSRPAEDRARDESRKPAEVVEFLGIEPGMRVLDIIAAGGYYTEVLSHAVGPEGEVVAHNTDASLQYGDGANEKAISARLAGNRLPNVTRLNKNFDEISAADGPFDAAITALNFHDIYYGSGPDAAVDFLGTVYEVLKPGGVLGITDHVGDIGANNEEMHRVEKAKVIESAVAAGFQLEGESDVLRNAADDHLQSVFSDTVRGNTDRFVLKFRKPEK